MRKRRSRTEVAKSIARALSSVHRLTGGKGKAWHKAVRILVWPESQRRRA